MSAYVILAIAIVSEVFAEAMMKLSNGFEKKAPIIGIVLGYLIAFYLMAQTLNELPSASSTRYGQVPAWRSPRSSAPPCGTRASTPRKCSGCSPS